MAISQCLASVIPFSLELDNFTVKGSYSIMGLINGSHEVVSFAFPSLHSIELGATPAEFGLDFLA